MEKGTATIAWGTGSIAAATGSSPVYFDPAAFSNVRPGAVYFRRSGSKPSWAIEVVNAAQVDALVALATPGDGYVAGVVELTRAAAARYVAEAQFAPTPTAGRAHLKFAKDRMLVFAAALRQQPQPHNLDAVEKLLKA